METGQIGVEWSTAKAQSEPRRFRPNVWKVVSRFRVVRRVSSFSSRTVVPMPTCPVCDEQVNADEAAFTRHVNAHFDEEEEETVGGHPSVGHPPGAQLG